MFLSTVETEGEGLDQVKPIANHSKGVLLLTLVTVILMSICLWSASIIPIYIAAHFVPIMFCSIKTEKKVKIGVKCFCTLFLLSKLIFLIFLMACHCFGWDGHCRAYRQVFWIQ